MHSAKQALFQLVYLLHVGSNGSDIILFSPLLSFVNLTASICSDDAKLFGIGFSTKNKWSGDSTRTEFLALYAFRTLEIPSKLLLYALLWYCVSGSACAAVVLVDLMVAVALFWNTKQL